MNSIAITAKPQFRLNVSLPDMALLYDMGNSHYDATCRAACRPNGFIFKWIYCLQMQQGNPEYAALICATWQELDIASKVLENTFGLGKEQMLIVQDLRALIHRAMVKGQEHFNGLEIKVT